MSRLSATRGRRPRKRTRRPPRRLTAIQEKNLWRLSLLRHFADTSGLDKLKKNTRVAPGVNLGRWARFCREKYRAGEIDGWLEDGLERIEGWEWHPVDARLRRKLELLKLFVKERGWRSLLVANPGTRFRDVDLGAWVMHLRIGHRRKHTTPWLARELERIPGWSWGLTRDESHGAMLQLLEDYRRLGAALGMVPLEIERLGKWVHNQRTLRRMSKLPRGRATLLKAVLGWTWDRSGT